MASEHPGPWRGHCDRHPKAPASSNFVLRFRREDVRCSISFPVKVGLGLKDTENFQIALARQSKAQLRSAVNF